MSKIDKERLIELRVAGKTTAEIAKVFECSNQAVSDMTRQLIGSGELDGDWRNGFRRPIAEEAAPDVGSEIEAAEIDPEDYIAEKHLQSDEIEPGAEPRRLVDVVRMEEDEKAADARLAEEERKTGKTVAEYLAEEEEEAEARRKAAVAEEIHPMFAKKPPLGVMPRWLFWESRRDDLRRAICEYACEGLVIDPEWVAEYNELVVREEGRKCKM